MAPPRVFHERIGRRFSVLWPLSRSTLIRWVRSRRRVYPPVLSTAVSSVDQATAPLRTSFAETCQLGGPNRPLQNRPVHARHRKCPERHLLASAYPSKMLSHWPSAKLERRFGFFIVYRDEDGRLVAHRKRKASMHKLLAALAVLAIASPAVRAEDQPIEIQIVDAMNKLWGTHPGFRANHAKGVVVEGSFTASPGAAVLSKAALFDGSAIPVTVRFSNSTGMPNVPDGSAVAIPHGMALKFHLPDGSDTDMVLNALKFFPVATGADFRDLLLALAASPADAAKPTKFDEFVASHPSVPAALASTSTPASFAEQEYSSKSITASMRSCSSARPARGRWCAIR